MLKSYQCLNQIIPHHTGEKEKLTKFPYAAKSSKREQHECFLQDVLLSDGIFAEDRISFMLSCSVIKGYVRMIIK